MLAFHQQMTLEGSTVSSAQSGLPVYRTTIRDEWIDYNGHLSEAYYVLIFGFTSDQLMVHLGMDAEYRQRTGCSLYTVEAHIRYLLEVPPEAEVEVVPQIITAGDKKLHLAYEMYSAGDLVATEEILALHVGGEPVASRVFPDDVRERIEQARAAHDASTVPRWIGRAIG